MLYVTVSECKTLLKVLESREAELRGKSTRRKHGDAFCEWVKAEADKCAKLYEKIEAMLQEAEKAAQEQEGESA